MAPFLIRWTLILLLTGLLSPATPAAHASQGMSESSPPADRLERIEQECFQKDWTQEACRLLGKDYDRSIADSIADPLIFDPVFTLLSTITASTVYSLPSTLEGPSRTCSNGACTSIYQDGEALLHSLSRRIQEKARVPGTRDCQKICIATCVTSRLLKYEKSLIYEASPESTAAILGRGACTEYSRIADRFIGDLGFESYTVGNLRLRHQYNWIRIDSGSYYIEPQFPGCGFIKTE